MMQCSGGPPPVYCETCGTVGLETDSCLHRFERDLIACDYSGIWQRKQVEGLYRERVSLLVHHLPNPDWAGSVDLHFWRDQRHLSAILARLKARAPGLRVATHNYGNATALRVLRSFPDAVLVVHDLHHLEIADRTGVASERSLLQAAQRIVFPSDEMRAAVARHLRPGTRTIVQHQRVPERRFCWRDDCAGVVYQGRISESWGGVFRQLRESGHRLRVMPSIINPAADYSAFGELSPAADYTAILDACSRARWGLTGSPVACPSMGRSMSNKFWDYLAAGCVPVVLHHPAVARVVEATGCGVVARDVPHLLEIVADEGLWRAARARIAEARPGLTMEGQREEWGAIWR